MGPVLGVLALGAMLGTTLACTEPPRERDEHGRVNAAPATTIPADGWNDRIAWHSLDAGLRVAEQTGKPIMMVVHTSWCGNCRKLKPTFAQPKLVRLSENFVMIHVDQDEQPEVRLYAPDGDYIPRVMFLDSSGNVDRSLQNPNKSRTDRFRYFYTPREDLVATMRAALDQHGNKT